MKTHKRHGSHVIKLTLAFLIATILLLWGWNIAIPDLFELPAMQFKQALGLMILIGTVSFLLRRSRGHGGEKSTSPHHNNSVMGKQS
jgi:hypothetical protein